jgi:glycosyltransferase involved in cell wall biosynthesis
MSQPKSNKKYLTIFPHFEPVLLNKDVGAIPYFLAIECGWKSSLAFFYKSSDAKQALNNDRYGQVVSMISLGTVGNKISNGLRIMRFLISRAKEFDIVNFYHDSIIFMACSLLYKMSNRSGKVYFKLDMSHLELQMIVNNRNKIIPTINRFVKSLLSKRAVDLYSVETRRIYDALVNDSYYADRLYYFPNGFTYDGELDVDQVMREKENIILVVGRLGSYPKHNELLIDAAMRIDRAALKEWKIYFVGPIDNEEFVQYKDNAIHKYPYLESIFVFTGNISDRSRLYELYKKSKILCLTSRWESFGFVLTEAMFFANYIIASDLPSSRDLTKEGTIGSLFNIGDAQKLAELLADAISGKVDLIKNGKESHEFIKSKFNWKIIVKEIDQKLKRLMED